MLDGNDRARTAHVKHVHGADPVDPRLHRLVIDAMSRSASATGEPVVAARVCRVT
ncbi:hypothetical protein [Actinomadura pelletieri]|uniref:hypothetical protein n=1 Tax=Actinomadura pelletieri TaxID=111805 RepID=UPI001476E09F|nr:hypothetical protein [Actinomadura pelletieri]